MPTKAGDGSVNSAEWIELGKISGVFGVRGWVKVYSFTRERDDILEYGSWYLRKGGDWREYTVEQGQLHSGTVIARLSGCESRETAFELIGARIAVPASRLKPAVIDEYYWRDLVGLDVVNLQGRLLGQIGSMMETGANDVMVVTGDRERLIPFVRETVLSVELSAGIVNVDWDSEF